jgi:hypothetical protein
MLPSVMAFHGGFDLAFELPEEKELASTLEM